MIALVQLGTSECIKGKFIIKDPITNHESRISFRECNYRIFFGSPEENIENSTKIPTYQQEAPSPARNSISSSLQETPSSHSTDHQKSIKWPWGMTTSDVIWCSVAITSITVAIILLIFVILDFRKIKAQQKKAMINKAKVLFKPKKAVPNQYVV